MHDSWPTSLATACLSYGAIADIAPGDTLRPSELSRRFPLAEILADSLPAGAYDMQALLRIGPSARVPLGEIHLPTTRFPLPEHVTYRDGFRYEVSVEAAAGSDATVSLDVGYSAPAHAGSLERSVSATCPLRILAFRHATDPTTIPQPEADWVWPEACDESTEAIRLGTGGSRRFDLTLKLDEIAAPQAIEGQYFLVGIVDVDDRPIRLSLGTLEVAG